MTLRILVVFTGGTIGSQAQADSIGVVHGQTRRLLADYALLGTGHAEFEVIEPLNILSENAKPADWSSLVNAIRARQSDDYAGVIVTHGTDTLAYTAAALSFALEDLAAPVVLVASNHPLDHPEANGLTNFVDAVRLIAHAGSSGVFVTYANPDGRRLVHYGSRLLSATPQAHAFLSHESSEAAEFRGDTLIPLAGFRGDGRRIRGRVDRHVDSTFGGSVLLVHPHPSLDYSKLSLQEVDAVVHNLYHSGTACVSPGSEELSLVDFAARCSESDVPLFLAPWPAGTSLYESSRGLLESRVAPIVGMSAETAYVKVMFGVGAGLVGDDLREFVVEVQAAHEFV